jgi:tetratricopeptide (TPR) repeat protein
MAAAKPTSWDLIFRHGQAWIGTQDGKRNEMIHRSWKEQEKQTEILRQLAKNQTADPAIKEQQEQTALLREMVEEQRSRNPLVKYQPPAIYEAPTITQVISPQVDIDTLADRLGADFDNVVEAQRELAHKINGLGYIGQMALQESTEHTALLDSLDKHSQSAFLQRNEALGHMSRSIYEQQLANKNLGAIGNGIVNVRHAIDSSTGILGHAIETMNQAILAGLGDIGGSIYEINTELVKTRLSVIQTLQDAQGIFLWSHREQMWVKKQILDVLSNPRRTSAYETWQIGEQCRQTGDIDQAISFFRESIKINPTETRNYISLGLINLNTARPQEAKKYFAEAARRAIDPKQKAEAYMYLAKVEIFDKNFTQARDLNESAMNIDITNLEVWFDLAICEVKQRNYQKAIYYIDALLRAPLKVPKQMARTVAQYAIKIMATQEFHNLMPEIRKIMRQIINEAD